MEMLNRHVEPKRYRFSGKYIPENFDKLLTHFKAFLVGYIKDDKTDLSVFDYNDIIYCIKLSFVPEDIAKDIKNTAIKYNKIFNVHKFKDLLDTDDLAKISCTYSGGLIYIYRAKGIVFEIRVLKDDNSEFDMSINLLDSYGDVSVDKDDSSGCDLVKTKTDVPITNELKAGEPEEDQSELDTKVEKAISSIEANYLQYKNILRSLGSNITKEDVERLEALSKTIRTTSYSLSKPTTPENMLENLMAKNIINPEFKMAFTSMFDNLIEDPLTYFFAKYEGATTIDHKGRPLVLKFQFERKLYSMCFKYVNPNAGLDTEKLDKLFMEALAELYNIRLFFLKDLLGAIGDLPTFIKLVQDNDINEHGLSAQFYDYFYKKIAAFKTLASYYSADVFANNPTVNKCREMEFNIDDITAKIQQWLSSIKVEIAKLIYSKLQ